MASAATLSRLEAAYRARDEAIRARVLAYLERSWRGLDEIRDADVDRFVALVVPVVAGGQRQVAALTDAYLSQVELAVTGTTSGPAGIPSSTISIEAVRGVSAAEVYRRAGVTVWTALSKGVPFSAAADQGLARALELGATDLQLAKTHAARHVLSGRSSVTGYRRVLESGDPCELCIGAADRVYATDQLMPIHPHCACGVEPVFGDARVVEDAPEGGEADLAVRDHGELGPLLVVGAHEFTSEEDL